MVKREISKTQTNYIFNTEKEAQTFLSKLDYAVYPYDTIYTIYLDKKEIEDEE